MAYKFNSLYSISLDLPRSVKRLVAVLLDVCLCIVTVWLAFYLRLNEFVFLSGDLFLAALISVLIAVPIFIIFGLYRAVFRYSNISTVYVVSRAIGIYGMLYAVAITLFGIPGVPRTIGLIQPLLLFFAVALSRAAVQFLLGDLYLSRVQRALIPKALIYGAGSSGRQLAVSLNNSFDVQIIGFLDDNKALHKQIIEGNTVFSPTELPALIKSKEVSFVLLAMNSVNRRRRNEIIKIMGQYKVAVRTVPSLADITRGTVGEIPYRELDLEDLLGREPVSPNSFLLSKNIEKKTVLVTGAGGSIGGELCRQIIKQQCKKLILVEFNEFSLYRIHAELGKIIEVFPEVRDIELVPVLLSLHEKHRVSHILNIWKPDTIYHAAAYKHVPLVEFNVGVGVSNNVIASLNLAEAAIENGVSNFVMISTDKAVRPTNVMGASKRLAEISLRSFFDHHAGKGSARLSIVRFGNVLDSSGSVIPKFRDQIQDGGPITLTHPDITRYFMTIPEAAQLVIQADSLGESNSVFVLDMGAPVKIAELAARMVELSGLSIKDASNPKGNIEIHVVGLRPGEKLFEELLVSENVQPTKHTKIQMESDPILGWSSLSPELKKLKKCLLGHDDNQILEILAKLVVNYSPSSSVKTFVQLNIAKHNKSPN